jgi:hypothetical protein
VAGTSRSRRALSAVGLVVGAFLVVRGLAELFVIDMGNPATYSSDWGGPSLAGVLAVHSGPAVVVLAGVAVWLARRRRRQRSRR